MIHLGLIGCGAWGWRYIQAARETGLCGVTDATCGQNSSVIQEHRTIRFRQSRAWREILAAPIDAFIVATPPDTHEEICTELLAAGRPVMVEKPFALSLEAAARVADTARISGSPLLINHQHLFAPAYEQFREIVRGGAWETWASSGNDGPRRSYSALWDYGPHDVAMQIGLAESLDDASIARGAAHDAWGTDNNAWINMRLGAAMTGIVHVWNDHAPKTRRLAAENESHIVTYDALAPAPLMMDGLPIDVDGEQPLQRALRLFCVSIMSGKTDWRFGGDIGVQVTRILADAERMIADGQATQRGAS